MLFIQFVADVIIPPAIAHINNDANEKVNLCLICHIGVDVNECV